MDIRWRISDDQLSSNLFEKALEGGLALGPSDEGRSELLTFLHQTYDYDNLASYSQLLDQPWLSETLENL